MKFGTSGLRGLVADLEGRASALYAQAFARYLSETGQVGIDGTVLVGRDFRPSSPSISATCIGALTRAGLVPVDCGALPTPALALYGLHIGAPALMITGSHIPADRNGIKFYRADGEIDKQNEVQIAAIAAELAAGSIDYAPATAEDGHDAAMALFQARARSILPQKALSGLKIGVYQHSTVARDLLVKTVRAYGAQVLELGFSEEFIPVDTEAVSLETIAALRAWAREYKLDAIISADGDGDRPLLADENGEPLRGDLLGLIVARFLGAQVVVTPVTSNSGLESDGSFEVVRTRVGSPFVIAGMQAALHAGRSDVIGFEANGGLLTATAFDLGNGVLEPLPTRDSVLPVLAALHLAAETRTPLSAVAAAFQLPHAMADRLEHFPVEISAAIMDHLRGSMRNLQTFFAPLGTIASTSDIDGLRLTLDDGCILHLRPSGNAPEMRCYVEAKTNAAARHLLEDSLALMRRAGQQWTELSKNGPRP